MTKQEKLNAFVESKKLDDGVLAIVVFGSYARGNSRPDSDIDVVIIRQNGHERGVEFFAEQAFEIIYTTEESAIEYWNSHKHDAVSLWSVAQIAYDRDGTGKRLMEYGQNLCKEKPGQFDDSLLSHLRFDATYSIEALTTIYKTDPATALLLAHKLVSQMIGLYFDRNQQWRPAPKQELARITESNQELGELLRNFFISSDFQEKIALMKKIVSLVLD